MTDPAVVLREYHFDADELQKLLKLEGPLWLITTDWPRKVRPGGEFVQGWKFTTRSEQ